MERIGREKHDIESEKIDGAEAQRKEDREVAERHDQYFAIWKRQHQHKGKKE